jgi:hypothetical protein
LKNFLTTFQLIIHGTYNNQHHYAKHLIKSKGVSAESKFFTVSLRPKTMEETYAVDGMFYANDDYSKACILRLFYHQNCNNDPCSENYNVILT